MDDFKRFRAGLLALGIGTTTALAMAAPAAAQYGASPSNIMIDLSVIEDGGAAAVPAPNQTYSAAPQGGLVMPGRAMPGSTFIAPPSDNAPRITLKKPGNEAADTGSSFMAPPPAEKPVSTMAAKEPTPAVTPPKPKLAPPPKIVEPAKPAPKPIAKPAPKPEPEPVKMAAKAPVSQEAKPLEPPAPPAVKKPTVTAEEVPPPPKPAKLEAPKAPTPLPKAAPAEKPLQVAAVAPKAPVESGSTEQIAFSGGASKLPNTSKPLLDKLAAEINDSTEKRLQVLAYAGGDNLSASKARRLSLSRALAVRSYMISKGVKSTRIDVRALGDKAPEGDPNRVDLKVVTR